MAWNQVSPGRFERPLDSIETFFKTIATTRGALKREHWAVSICAQFKLGASAGDTEPALRHAWKTMRYDHPQIASSAQGLTKIYEIPDASAVEPWLTETFVVTHTGTSNDLLASFEPLPLPVIHYLPHTSEILIHMSHWRIDGIGAVQLLRNLFKALARPCRVEFGDEWKNLSPSRDEAAELPLETTKESEIAAMKLMMEFAGNIPSIGIPNDVANQIPGSTRRAELTIPTETTSAIVAASKARSLTITSALHAATVVATQQVAPVESAAFNKYTSWGCYNLRPYLPEPFSNTAAHPVALYLVGLPITLPPATFSENAALLQHSYKRSLSLSSGDSYLRDILISYSKKITAMISMPKPPHLPMPTEPMLNSIGVLDRDLDLREYGVEITKFWLAVEMLTRQIEFYVWTWQGKMTLSACYNEQFYDPELINSFLERVKNVLVMELGIAQTEGGEKVMRSNGVKEDSRQPLTEMDLAQVNARQQLTELNIALSKSEERLKELNVALFRGEQQLKELNRLDARQQSAQWIMHGCA